jgi:DNA-binding transcriptional LysR family regulator
VAAGPLVPIIELLTDRYPRVRLHVDQFATPMLSFPELERRDVDLVLARLNPSPHAQPAEALDIEVLFEDRFCVAVGAHCRLAGLKKIELADLVSERWIMTSADSPGGAAVQKLFRDAGLPKPEFMISTFSVFLRNTFVSSGRFVTALPASVLRLNTQILRELPIAVPMPRWPVAIVTLKNRELNPAAKLFIECAREAAKSIASKRQTRKPRPKG